MNKKAANRGPEIAKALENWGKKYGTSDNVNFKNLHQSLVDGENLDFWTTQSARDALPLGSISENRLHRIYFYMVLVRNTLIFAPVGITWLAIGEAAKAFKEFASQQPDSVVNFLTFWQDGYGILDDHWTLSKVATLDAVILIFVIALLVITTVIKRSIDQTEKAKIRVAREDRMEVVLLIDTFLHSEKKETPQSLNQNVVKTIKDLKKASETLNKASKELKKVFDSAPSNSKILSELKKLSTDKNSL
jgi:methyl-accepting chemotaxis protein